MIVLREFHDCVCTWPRASADSSTPWSCFKFKDNSKPRLRMNEFCLSAYLHTMEISSWSCFCCFIRFSLVVFFSILLNESQREKFVKLRLLWSAHALQFKANWGNDSVLDWLLGVAQISERRLGLLHAGLWSYATSLLQPIHTWRALLHAMDEWISHHHQL